MYVLQRVTGRSIFFALLWPTATAMAGEISPCRASATIMPIGPIM